MPRIYVQFYSPKIVRNKRTIKVNVFVSGFLHHSILLKFSTQQFMHIVLVLEIIFFLNFPCILIYQVWWFSTMKNIQKSLLLFNPVHANTSFLHPLILGYIEMKQGSKLVNKFNKFKSSLSYIQPISRFWNKFNFCFWYLRGINSR